MVGGGRGGGNSGIGVNSGPGRDSGSSSQGDQRHTVGSGGRGGEVDGLVDGQRVGLPGGYGALCNRLGSRGGDRVKYLNINRFD